MAFNSIYSTDYLREMEPYFRIEVGGVALPIELCKFIEFLQMTEEENKCGSIEFKIRDPEARHFDTPLFQLQGTIVIFAGYRTMYERRGPFEIYDVDIKLERMGISLRVKAVEGGKLARRSSRRVVTSGTVRGLFERILRVANMPLLAEDAEGFDAIITEETPLVQRGETDAVFLQRVAAEFGWMMTVVSGKVSITSADVRKSLGVILLKYFSADANTTDISAKFKKPRVSYVPLAQARGKGKNVKENLPLINEISTAQAQLNDISISIDNIRRDIREEISAGGGASLINSLKAELSKLTKQRTELSQRIVELRKQAAKGARIVAAEEAGITLEEAERRVRVAQLAEKARSIAANDGSIAEGIAFLSVIANEPAENARRERVAQVSEDATRIAANEGSLAQGIAFLSVLTKEPPQPSQGVQRTFETDYPGADVYRSSSSQSGLRSAAVVVGDVGEGLDSVEAARRSRVDRISQGAQSIAANEGAIAQGIAFLAVASREPESRATQEVVTVDEFGKEVRVTVDVQRNLTQNVGTEFDPQSGQATALVPQGARRDTKKIKRKKIIRAGKLVSITIKLKLGYMAFRPNHNLEIEGVGRLIDGNYRVTKIVHEFSQSKPFSTKIESKRGWFKPKKKKQDKTKVTGVDSSATSRTEDATQRVEADRGGDDEREVVRVGELGAVLRNIE